MSQFTYTVHVDAPAQEVWSILADYGNVYKYSPGVKWSYTTSPQSQGLGASRHCDLLPMGSIEEKILAWQEGESYSLEIADSQGSPSFERAIATLAVEPDEHGARVTASFDYKLRYGVVGVLLDRLMVGRFLRKGIAGLLSGLKHYAETGEEIDNATAYRWAAVAC